MQGEYRGDFTRDTFDPANQFSRVLMQQGRVQLDADWNEQGSILLHYLRSLTADVIGQHGGPGPDPGFKISLDSDNNFLIGTGRYYVDGILCDAGPGSAYLAQSGVLNPADYSSYGRILVYLDVWERHVTCDQQNLLREVALLGPDTATRAQVVWQVKIAPPQPRRPWQQNAPYGDSYWQTVIELWQSSNRGLLRARVQPQQMSTEPCAVSPESRYRGMENQLYRVEVHTGGPGSVTPLPIFKWSRENGSVAFPILQLTSDTNVTTVTLASLGRDSRLSLQVNDWVEVVDDGSVLSGVPWPLMKVQAIDPAALIVTLAGSLGSAIVPPRTKHPLLRRWEGTGTITESISDLPVDWLTLEDGVQIQFQLPDPQSVNSQYRSGDYWLIPARVATGDVEWPQQPVGDGKWGPAPVPPHGIEHHYAPLAIATYSANNAKPVITDLRRSFGALAKPVP